MFLTQLSQRHKVKQWLKDEDWLGGGICLAILVYIYVDTLRSMM